LGHNERNKNMMYISLYSNYYFAGSLSCVYYPHIQYIVDTDPLTTLPDTKDIPVNGMLSKYDGDPEFLGIHNGIESISKNERFIFNFFRNNSDENILKWLDWYQWYKEKISHEIIIIADTLVTNLYPFIGGYVQFKRIQVSITL
jgi:hypothetical protein